MDTLYIGFNLGGNSQIIEKGFEKFSVDFKLVDIAGGENFPAVTGIF
jgi:hypothetical protein